MSRRQEALLWLGIAALLGLAYLCGLSNRWGQ